MDDSMQDDQQQQPTVGGRPRPQITLNKTSGGGGGVAPAGGRRQIKTKGRGFEGNFGEEATDRYAGKAGEFERLQEEGGDDAQKCQSHADRQTG